VLEPADFILPREWQWLAIELELYQRRRERIEEFYSGVIGKRRDVERPVPLSIPRVRRIRSFLAAETVVPNEL
jgi:hypothetical protein